MLRASAVSAQLLLCKTGAPAFALAGGRITRPSKLQGPNVQRAVTKSKQSIVSTAQGVIPRKPHVYALDEWLTKTDNLKTQLIQKLD